MNRSMPGLPVHHQLPEFTQTHSIESVMPSRHLILCRPLLLLPLIPPSIKVFSSESTLHIGGQSTGVSALASFLPKKSQGWSPCSPRDSQEPSPIPQFKSINSSVLSFLHSPTLTSIHEQWKNHSHDNKLWKILKEMGIPDHLTCLLRNLYAGQEATVRSGHGTTD